MPWWLENHFQVALTCAVSITPRNGISWRHPGNTPVARNIEYRRELNGHERSALARSKASMKKRLGGHTECGGRVYSEYLREERSSHIEARFPYICGLEQGDDFR